MIMIILGKAYKKGRYVSAARLTDCGSDMSKYMYSVTKETNKNVDSYLPLCNVFLVALRSVLTVMVDVEVASPSQPSSSLQSMRIRGHSSVT